jgi:hypothetical protein
MSVEDLPERTVREDDAEPDHEEHITRIIHAGPEFGQANVSYFVGIV